jgi:hypothetical protein
MRLSNTFPEAQMMQACGWHTLCRSAVNLFIMLCTIASPVEGIEKIFKF